MHTRWPQRFAVPFLFVVLLTLDPPAALAHAVLLHSTPQKNAAVAGPDIQISLKYNSRVDGARSAISLLLPSGAIEKIGDLTQPLPDTVSATSRGLAKGAYVLRWQVLSSDGHITRGEVPFQIK